MQRRNLIRSALACTVGIAGISSLTYLNQDMDIANPQFANIEQAQLSLSKLLTTPTQTTQGWPLVKVLHHLTQSIEYSLTGFPINKSVAFQRTLGAGAFRVFSAFGRMHHGLQDEIPGASGMPENLNLTRAVNDLIDSLKRFDQYAGKLAPHFAYGELNKAQFARAHLMHIANHWQWVHAHHS